MDKTTLQDLGTIVPADVVAHAEARHWRRVSLAREDVALFKHPEGGFKQVIVPLDPTIEGYDRRIADVVGRFAEQENRPVFEVINDLLARSADVLRFRIAIPGADSGMMPFEDGVRLFDGMRRAILAAVRGAMKPQKYYPKLGGGSAEEFIKACKLGQTERGSYIATVACPIGLLPERVRDGMPFTRQATGLLWNTMAVVSNAIEGNQEERLLGIQDERAVVSSNLCEAIAVMQPEDERASLQVRCSWAPAVPFPDEATPIEITFRSPQRERLLSVAKRLKASEEVEPLIEYIASIERLHGEPNAAERRLGEIQIVIRDRGKTVRARMEVTPQDYVTACTAHRDGRGISFRGRIARGPRTRRIEEYRDFEILTGLPNFSEI